MQITNAITIDVAGVTGGNDTIDPIPPCPYNGQTGVRILRAKSVRIEDTTIRRQQKAVDVSPTSPVDVFVNRVDISESCTNAIIAAPAAGGSADVAIQDTTISNSNTALSVTDSATAWLTRTTIFGNALGLQALGTGVINDWGDNRLMANAADGAATSLLGTTKNAAVAGPAGPIGPTGPQGPQGEPAIKLLLAASQTKRACISGMQVVFSYAATAPARSTLTITKGKQKIATVSGTSKAGANTIRWNGKVGRKAAAAGVYELTLSAVGSDGRRPRPSSA